MTARANQSKPPPTHQGEAKTRACLMCREAFESAWPGERVCKRCKSGKAWRAGSARRGSAGRQIQGQRYGSLW